MIINETIDLNPGPTPTVLKEGDLTLTPGSLIGDRDLILRFAMGDRYNKTPEEQLTRGLDLIKYLWIGKVDGVIGGLLFICQLEKVDWWTLDAYKNSEHDNKAGDFSFRAARLVMDWFFQNHDEHYLYTMHRTDNHGATKICERLGFEKRYINQEFIILRYKRDLWVLGRS